MSRTHKLNVNSVFVTFVETVVLYDLIPSVPNFQYKGLGSIYVVKCIMYQLSVHLCILSCFISNIYFVYAHLFQHAHQETRNSKDI